MKQKFDNAGAAQVQATVLALPSQEREEQINMIRTDFSGWIQSQFLLETSQIVQLESMPADLREQIAEGLASSWENGILVNFHKEENSPTKSKGAKEIIYTRNTTNSTQQGQQSFASGHAIEQISIWIRYRTE